MSGVFVRSRITIKLPTMSTIRLTGGGSRGNNDREEVHRAEREFKDKETEGPSLANRPLSSVEKEAPKELPPHLFHPPSRKKVGRL